MLGSEAVAFQVDSGSGLLWLGQYFKILVC